MRKFVVLTVIVVILLVAGAVVLWVHGAPPTGDEVNAALVDRYGEGELHDLVTTWFERDPNKPLHVRGWEISLPLVDTVREATIIIGFEELPSGWTSYPPLSAITAFHAEPVGPAARFRAKFE